MDIDVDVEKLLKLLKENIFSVVVISICLMVAFKIYNGNQAVIASLKQTEETERKKNEVLQEISGLEKGFQSLKDKVNNKAITSIIYSLTTLAKNSDVKITYIRPEGEANAGTYLKYPFELSVSASSYHKLGKFVSRLENAPEFYSVDKMDLAVGNGQVNAHLSVSTILIQ